MIPALAYLVLILSAAATVWGLTTAVVNRAPGVAQLLFAAALELVTVVQSVVATVKVVLGFRPAELVTTVGYLLVIVVWVPLAWFWIERTRPGLHLRAIGEAPAAADAQGIGVHRLRLAYVVFGGVMAGLAG